MTDDGFELVGQIGELWRFPVKSMQGERVASVELGANGVIDDRQWALRDRRTGKVLSAKRYGHLLEAVARLDGGRVVIELPDGRTFAADDTGADAALSDWLASEVELVRASPDRANGAYEFAFDVEDSPDAEWFDIDMPAGSFVDLARAHLLTTSSIAAASGHHPDGAWDCRRFRPTALIDTGDTARFVEDEWVGRVVRLGSATLSVEMPTIRCAIPTRTQPALVDGPALPRDTAVSRVLADHHDSNLGVYCEVVAGGTVAVGDSVAVAVG